MRITKKMQNLRRHTTTTGSVLLLEWRFKNRYRQVDVAKLLGNPNLAPLVSQWERSLRVPSREQRAKLQNLTDGYVLGRSWKEKYA